MATIATAAKADKVLGWWEFFREKMMIEGATDEADTAGLRGREVSVRQMCRHTQKESVSIFFLKSRLLFPI